VFSKARADPASAEVIRADLAFERDAVIKREISALEAEQERERAVVLSELERLVSYFCILISVNPKL